MTSQTEERGVDEAVAKGAQDADKMQEDAERLGEHIADSRATLKAAQEDRSVPTAAVDADDVDDADNETGDEDSDPFDDPEADEEDEDD